MTLHANFEIPWIKQDSKNGPKIIDLLRRVTDWRHQSKLGSRYSRYDYFHSCYGNPDSNIIFVAQIANMTAIDHLMDEIPSDKLWAIPWYGHGRPPQILREALMFNRLIPPFCEHEPWKWKCWITNFVKTPESDAKWHMKGTEWDGLKKEEKEAFRMIKEETKRKNAEFLEEEIDIIRPKCIVFIGSSVETYFSQTGLRGRLKEKRPNIRFYKLPHYSARKSPEKLRKIYQQDIRRLLKEC